MLMWHTITGISMYSNISSTIQMSLCFPMYTDPFRVSLGNWPRAWERYHLWMISLQSLMTILGRSRSWMPWMGICIPSSKAPKMGWLNSLWVYATRLGLSRGSTQEKSWKQRNLKSKGLSFLAGYDQSCEPWWLIPKKLGWRERRLIMASCWE